MELFFIIVLLLLPFPIHAEVVINEFAVQPTQTVEIFNAASVSADISHWYIDDSGGSTYYTIPANTILPPQTCAVFTGDFNLNKSSADTVRLFTAEYPPTTPSAVLID